MTCNPRQATLTSAADTPFRSVGSLEFVAWVGLATFVAL